MFQLTDFQKLSFVSQQLKSVRSFFVFVFACGVNQNIVVCKTREIGLQVIVAQI